MVRAQLRRLRAAVDWFVPRSVDDHDIRASWRALVAFDFLVAPFVALIGIQYALLGIGAGALVIFLAAASVLLSPFLGKRTGSRIVMFTIPVTVSALLLAMLTLNKGEWTLSTIMWLTTMPLAAGLALGARAMLICAGLIVTLGCSVFALIQSGIHVGSFPDDPSVQDQIALVSWIAFVIVATGIAYVYRQTLARKEMERQQLASMLESSRHLEAIGRLAGGVAHEFNNLLTIILGNAALARAEITTSGLEESLQDIEGAAQRGSEIARELLLFARGEVSSPSSPAAVDVIVALQAALRLVDASVGDDIVVERELPSACAPAAVSARIIEQTLLNLAINARDAMPMGGVMRVTLEEVDLSGQEAEECGLTAGEWLRLRVADGGCGIDEVAVSHVFEPFFTTKEAGKGTGLGLSVVFGLIRSAGGTITVESSPGEGTRFDVYLPVAESAESDAEPALGPPRESVVVRARESIADPEPEARSVILLVEDEPWVRNVTRRALGRRGHEVLVAEDGVRALERLETRSVDLVVSDVRMPRMDGLSLARTLRAEGNDVALLFISGHAGDDGELEEIRALGAELVVKPFSPEQLVAAVSRRLASVRIRRRKGA